MGNAIAVLGLSLGTVSSLAYGVHACTAESNQLPGLVLSPGLVHEKVVPPEELDPIQNEKLCPRSGEFNSLGEYLKCRSSRYLDPGDKEGWDAVLRVHGNTLSGLTREQLIDNCQALLNQRIEPMTALTFEENLKVVARFCSFPMRVKQKVTSEMLEKYKKQRPKAEWTEAKCRRFASSYTIALDITLEEMEFMGACHSRLLGD